MSYKYYFLQTTTYKSLSEMCITNKDKYDYIFIHNIEDDSSNNVSRQYYNTRGNCSKYKEIVKENYIKNEVRDDNYDDGDDSIKNDESENEIDIKDIKYDFDNDNIVNNETGNMIDVKTERYNGDIEVDVVKNDIDNKNIVDATCDKVIARNIKENKLDMIDNDVDDDSTDEDVIKSDDKPQRRSKDRSNRYLFDDNPEIVARATGAHSITSESAFDSSLSQSFLKIKKK